ncbi:MAG: PCRF domain-containing protein, partial [Enterobacteriaceae bacterium]|nr:PCRF domain-containing protein [Enterobacteriaceae bacterium]
MLFKGIDYSTNFSKFDVLFNEFSKLKKIIFIVNCFEIDLNDMFEFFDISKIDNDLVILSELSALIDVFENKLYKFEIESFFANENDKCDAFLDIQSGSGGIDAQDWASMLLNMYSCWANRNEFKFDLLNISHGEVAGIKNASVKVSGDYSYGWLKLESGIHRLVRKSPFSSNGKRHTSFASVFVYPDNYKDLKIDISDSDLKIDTYKSGGAGGQHVNKT